MSEFTPQDCAFMARALRLAERGRYTAHPNPVVGCVLVKDDDVVGEGRHRKTGEAHAEVNALQQAGDQASGATAYVTLEPCSHQGKTPPCADALIAAGVSRVLVAVEDPHQKVAGQGLRKLRDAGIEVSTGLMHAAAKQINRGFFSRVSDGRPFVRLKLASSIDGAIAMANGESQWITGPAARDDVHRLRARSGAIMTGIGTVLADDPSLNVRSDSIDNDGLQPLRVVLDSKLRMPLSARMLTVAGATLVCCAGERDARALQNANAEVQCFDASADGRVDVRGVLQALASREINDVLVECGPDLAGHLLEADLVDELVIYQAPHIMGSNTKRLINTPTWSSLADRRTLTISDVRRIGDDTRITASLRQQT